MSPLRPGLVLDDKVRLIRELGEGAMGTVWTAKHLALDVEVAVKLIRRFVDDDEVRARFDMEAKAAARIRSPHVVQILDHGVAEGERPYMVMELLEGESLAERLERTGWLSVPQCVRVLTQVAKALDRAHAVGVVHRDVKPENIFLCPGDNGPFVKLLDFGVAKTTAIGQDPKLTNAGVMIGTPEYMSRQQIISSKHVEPEADLWALAVVAYEMLTGDVPFTGETVGQVCVAVCTGDYLPPTALRKGLPAGIDAWFEAILAKGETCPYASASELAKAFRATLLPERYSIDDELSDEAFRARGATAVGLGPRSDSGDAAPVPLVTPSADQRDPVLVVHDDLAVPDGGGSESAAASGDSPDDVGIAPPPVDPRGGRWLIAAGLLPLVVGAALFASQPAAPSMLDSFPIEAPSVAAATEARPEPTSAESTEGDAETRADDASDDDVASSAASATKPRPPVSPSVAPTPPSEHPGSKPVPPEPTDPEPGAALPPEPHDPPTSAGPTGDERTDYGF